MNLGSWVPAPRKDAVTLLPRGGKLTSHDPFNKRGDLMAERRCGGWLRRAIRDVRKELKKWPKWKRATKQTT